MVAMENIKQIIPLLCSLANLGCGYGVIMCVVYGRYEVAPWLIIIAMIFDAYDGRLARYLNATSRLGCELDSLCDVTTFGIAPAMLIGGLLQRDFPLLGWFLGFAFVSSAVYRLARFNAMAIEGEDSKQCFTGLPTTGAGGMIAALVILHEYLTFHSNSRVVLEILPIVSVVLSVLMVTRIKFPNSMSAVADKLSSPIYTMLVIAGIVLFAIIPQILPALLFGGYILVAFIGVLKEKLALRTHKL
jgi:CDP-diacylglycerol--serine O-phosphatidyltransferase